MDVRMPEINGFELCSQIHANQDHQHIPVIFLSAANEMKDKLAGFKAGGVDYILKPFDVDEIIIRIQTHLKLHRLQIAMANARAEVERQVQERTIELQAAIRALRQSEEKYRGIFNATSDALIIHDPSGRIIDVNERMCVLFGYDRGTALKLSVKDISSNETPYSQSEAMAKVSQALQEGSQVFEWRSKRCNGELFWSEVALRACEIAGQNWVIAAVRDITERKLVENKLRATQKMEAIGQLAGGVAHDFNNILAAMLMNLNLMQMNQTLDEDSQGILKELVIEANRAATLTRQLLMFSRRSVLEVKALDLNEVVSNLLLMLRRLIGEHIELQFHQRASMALVEADPGMLEQVLMNLCVNARDAMPKGGCIVITTGVVDIDEEHARNNPDMRSGQFVCLSVGAEGFEKNEATLKRIFEPFFTTKEAGKGTGLGLATVYGIVSQHKGWVEVESRVDQGTTFRIYLPATAESKVESTRDENIAIAKGHETILLVEDEQSVRRALKKALHAIGYQVLEAGSGREAMVHWQQCGPKIDLLFTDMVMPEGTTGLELAEKLQTEKPGLKVIISTGYSAEINQAGKVAGSGIIYLPKPYQMAILGKTIQDCLHR